MPSPKIPSGPSPEQQRVDAEFERERVKYESEKRRFLEQVASYETLTRGAIQAQQNTFEYSPQTSIDPSGLSIPSRFDPSLKPVVTEGVSNFTWQSNGQTIGLRGQDQMNWYWAPNLGLRNPNA